MSFRYFLGNAGRNAHAVIAERCGGALPAEFTAGCHDRAFAAFHHGSTPLRARGQAQPASSPPVPQGWTSSATPH